MDLPISAAPPSAAGACACPCQAHTTVTACSLSSIGIKRRTSLTGHIYGRLMIVNSTLPSRPPPPSSSLSSLSLSPPRSVSLSHHTTPPHLTPRHPERHHIISDLMLIILMRTLLLLSALLSVARWKRVFGCLRGQICVVFRLLRGKFKGPRERNKKPSTPCRASPFTLSARTRLPKT